MVGTLAATQAIRASAGNLRERERERGAQDGQEDGQNCAAFLRDMVCLVKQFFDPHKNFSAQIYH